MLSSHCHRLLLPIPPSFAALVPSASVQWSPLCHTADEAASAAVRALFAPSNAEAESLVANLSPAPAYKITYELRLK